MATNELLTEAYNYQLPPELIATSAVQPADSAKLLVYDRKTQMVSHSTFDKIIDFLPSKLVVALNNTKVIKARLFGHKQSGGKIELLLDRPMDKGLFLVHIRGRVKVGATLLFDKGLSATVELLNTDGTRLVRFWQNNTPLDFEAVTTLLDEIGQLPLPPYMNKTPSEQDSIDYQSLFAKELGAVAAPTASLHFTPKLLESFKKNYDVCELTLHIGSGTFKPVESPTITQHPMHSERFYIPQETKELIDSDMPLLAVGTTVTRTIEHYWRTKELQGESQLFLHPQNRPLRINHLLTNFHLPKSTLLMLVSSFIGREVALSLYQEAIKKRYRFYSYGDAMLIL